MTNAILADILKQSRRQLIPHHSVADIDHSIETRILLRNSPQIRLLGIAEGFGGMTGYTVHTGSSVKFSSGWDHIFQSKKKAAGTAEGTPAKTAKSTKKAAVKKAAKKKAPTATKTKAASKSTKRVK